MNRLQTMTDARPRSARGGLARRPARPAMDRLGRRHALANLLNARGASQPGNTGNTGRAGKLLAAALLTLPLLVGTRAIAAPAGPAAPGADTRIEAQTESFELLVQAQGPRLTLYLDRYADNVPVTDARIELDAGGSSVAVKAQPDGSYAAELPDGARRTTLPLTVVVTAGETSDLLALELPAQPAAGASAADAKADADGAPPNRDVTPAAVLRGLLVAAGLIALTAWALRALGRRHTLHAHRPPAPGKDPA